MANVPVAWQRFMRRGNNQGVFKSGWKGNGQFMGAPPHPRRHWIIGDVHGCSQALQSLVNRLPVHDHLILLGDVINRGPQVEKAMDLAWSLVSSGRGTWLKGNHEKDLVERMRGNGKHSDSDRDPCQTVQQLGEGGCRRWLERLDSLPLVHAGEGWTATHAGFDPLTWEPDLNIRGRFWSAYDGRFGDVVVGHTPGPGVRRLGQVVLVDTGACYGGRLSAYCPQTTEVISVRGDSRPDIIRWRMEALPSPC